MFVWLGEWEAIEKCFWVPELCWNKYPFRMVLERAKRRNLRRKKKRRRRTKRRKSQRQERHQVTVQRWVFLPLNTKALVSIYADKIQQWFDFYFSSHNKMWCLIAIVKWIHPLVFTPICTIVHSLWFCRTWRMNGLKLSHRHKLPKPGRFPRSPNRLRAALVRPRMSR